MTEKEIILKMWAKDGKIPRDILEILGITDQPLLVTLYSDGTLKVEPAPTLKKPSPPSFKKVKGTTPWIPSNWINISKNIWLTPSGDIKRLYKDKITNSLSFSTLKKDLEIIGESIEDRDNALEKLMNSGMKSSTATYHYWILKSAKPYLEKWGLLKEEKPKIKPPEELAKILEEKEEEPI